MVDPKWKYDTKLLKWVLKEPVAAPASPTPEASAEPEEAPKPKKP